MANASTTGSLSLLHVLELQLKGMHVEIVDLRADYAQHAMGMLLHLTLEMYPTGPSDRSVDRLLAALQPNGLVCGIPTEVLWDALEKALEQLDEPAVSARPEPVSYDQIDVTSHLSSTKQYAQGVRKRSRKPPTKMTVEEAVDQEGKLFMFSLPEKL